jgi:hypothetical protein
VFRSHEKHTALDNGPYLVRGPETITGAEGNQLHTDRETVALCRCGARRPNRSAMAHIRRQVFRQRTGTSNRRARVKSKRSSPNWVIESLRLFLATPLMAMMGWFAHYLEHLQPTRSKGIASQNRGGDQEDDLQNGCVVKLSEMPASTHLLALRWSRIRPSKRWSWQRPRRKGLSRAILGVGMGRIVRTIASGPVGYQT